MGNKIADQPGIDLGRYGAVLASRWRVVLVGTLIGLLIAVGYLLVTPSTYTSTTSLSVFPITSDPYAGNRNSSNLLDMEAEAASASSFRVADIAADSTGGTWDSVDLRRSTTVTAGGDGSTMTIAVTADSEARAREGAAALAESYITARSQQASNTIDQVVQRDQARISALREELTASIERLAAEQPGSPAAAEASADQQITNLQLSALLTRISDLEGVDTTGGIILNPASKTAIAVEPSRWVVLATGLAAGLGLGIVAAFVVQSRRRLVSGPKDLVREFGLDTLGGWGPKDDTDAAIAIAAERLVRVCSTYDASSLLLIVDDAVPAAEVLRSRLVDAVDRSTASADVDPGPRVQVRSTATLTTEAERLHAMRTSEVSVIVAASGATHLRDVERLLADAQQMGSTVVGAVLVPSKATEPSRHMRSEEREGRASRGRVSEDAHVESVDHDELASRA